MQAVREAGYQARPGREEWADRQGQADKQAKGNLAGRHGQAGSHARGGTQGQEDRRQGQAGNNRLARAGRQ